MDRVLDPQGFLAPLAAKGYLVEAPDEASEDASSQALPLRWP